MLASIPTRRRGWPGCWMTEFYRFPQDGDAPDVAPVKRAAAKVGRAFGQRAKYEKAVAALNKVLHGLETPRLRFWADCLMIDGRWCGATGQGGYWAVASEKVNELAGEELKTRSPRGKAGELSAPR